MYAIIASGFPQSPLASVAAGGFRAIDSHPQLVHLRRDTQDANLACADEGTWQSSRMSLGGPTDMAAPSGRLSLGLPRAPRASLGGASSRLSMGLGPRMSLGGAKVRM
jgi:hypothetical protein